MAVTLSHSQVVIKWERQSVYTRRQYSRGYLRILHTIQTTLKLFKMFFLRFMIECFLLIWCKKKIDKVFTSLFTEFSNINGLCGQMATHISFCAK